MTIRFNLRWLLVLSLVFSLQLCRAQVVIPPVVSFDLGDSAESDTALWDLQGQYTLNMNVNERNGLVLPISLSFVLLQDASGKLSSPTNDNTESLVVNENGLFAVLPRVTGKVTGFGGMAQVQLSIRFTGAGQIAGQPTSTVNGTFSVSAETDPTTGDLVGTKIGKFSISISGQGGASGVVNDFATPMPNGTNGTWNISLQLVGLKKVTGSAAITTPSRALGLDVSGAFKNDTFNLKAKGVNNVQDTVSGVGSSARILLTPAFDTIVIQGKVLGQTLEISSPED